MTPTQFREGIASASLRSGRLQPLTARGWAKSGLSDTATILLRLMPAGKISERDVRLRWSKMRFRLE